MTLREFVSRARGIAGDSFIRAGVSIGRDNQTQWYAHCSDLRGSSAQTADRALEILRLQYTYEDLPIEDVEVGP